jgi:hypothetical protein
MHPLAQQRAQRIVDQPVALHAGCTGKGARHDLHREVAFAARIMSGMAAMLGAVVDHGEPFGRKGSLQQLCDLGRDRPGGMLLHRAYIAVFEGDSPLAEARPKQPRFHGRVAGARPCDETGCQEAGEFRAPAENGARAGFDGPGAWRWLCLDHVRAFNARYNFFDGMSAEEISAQQTPYAGWARETRAFSTNAGGTPRWADFLDPLDAIQARFATGGQQPRKDGKQLSDADRRALRTLGLDADADRRALRQRYSELVRRYHPDRNGGDRSQEGQLQKVIDAYNQLKKAPAFA